MRWPNQHNTIGWFWLLQRPKKAEHRCSALLTLPRRQDLVLLQRAGHHFTILTASAILCLPLMSHETRTFSPAFRPGFLKALGSVKVDPLSRTRLIAVPS